MKKAMGNSKKIIIALGPKWIPGLPCPIDPIAAEEAQKLKIRAIVIRGTDLKNFERLLSDKKFRGTIIEP